MQPRIASQPSYHSAMAVVMYRAGHFTWPYSCCSAAQWWVEESVPQYSASPHKGAQPIPRHCLPHTWLTPVQVVERPDHTPRQLLHHGEGQTHAHTAQEV